MVTNIDMSQIHEHHAAIRREVAANRLARELRANRRGQHSPTRNLAWELSRFGGILAKRFRIF